MDPFTNSVLNTFTFTSALEHASAHPDFICIRAMVDALEYRFAQTTDQSNSHSYSNMNNGQSFTHNNPHCHHPQPNYHQLSMPSSWYPHPYHSQNNHSPRYSQRPQASGDPTRHNHGGLYCPPRIFNSFNCAASSRSNDHLPPASISRENYISKPIDKQ